MFVALAAGVIAETHPVAPQTSAVAEIRSKTPLIMKSSSLLDRKSSAILAESAALGQFPDFPRGGACFPLDC
jgi:hypothetical protein